MIPSPEMIRVKFTSYELDGVLWSKNDGYVPDGMVEIRPLLVDGQLADYVILVEEGDYRCVS